MRMMPDASWNGMKRKSADLRGGSSALCLSVMKPVLWKRQMCVAVAISFSGMSIDHRMVIT